MKYEEMSNREVNLSVAARLGLSLAPVSPQDGDGLIVYPHSNKVNFDPCSNPSDIMPIAIKYGFSIEIPDDNLNSVGTITKYIPDNTDIQVDYNDKDETYRAIAICFLKMKDAEVK